MPTVTLHYSEGLVRAAVQAFWWRTVGPGVLVVTAVLAVLLGIFLSHGDRTFWVGALGACLAFILAFLTMIYIVHYRGSLGRFRRMREPAATLEMGEERFLMASDAGRSERGWAAVTELWRFPDFWLLFFSPAQFVTLPTADLPEAAREFIVEKLSARRVKMR